MIMYFNFLCSCVEKILSLCEKSEQIAENKYEDHKKKCRMTGRKRDVSTNGSAYKYDEVRYRVTRFSI
jgi:hypothetical protein